MVVADITGDRGPIPRSTERLRPVGGHNGDQQVALNRPRGHGDVDRGDGVTTYFYREGFNRGGCSVGVLNPGPADKHPRENHEERKQAQDTT
ncbi:MAG: hypothetical protein PVG97_05555 [Syntrophobacterales bacterium]